MKIELLDLVFHSEHFYIEQKSIVEQITFNNRTFYSKFEKIDSNLNAILLEQHHKHQIILAVPLVETDFVNYIVIEYQQDDWNNFYSLVKHLLKSLDIKNFQAYRNTHKKRLQLFILREKTKLDDAYKEVENIKHLLQLKSKKSYKIYPNKNLPKNFNIITLPTQKI
ncbi:MAG: Unknown protein [uncultured Sulfurovum sp.]|uniref:DUF1882 domain-containing protein n=1 Tax=uncultured Sulfurovum sp. TaxID=269237 RepID=A0A6S6TU92_9BACT|nr:MAG: Unknown protein [uncultured Sulfurovum sp.]